jgi:hypothetical protein
MASDIKRLIGDDGKLVRASVGAVAHTTLSGLNWYKIAAKKTVSDFGDLAVGDYYYAPANKSLSGGDTAYLVSTTDMADLSGWSLELSADEVEVTVMDDTYKKYRKGKLDANGTCSFVFIRGTTDDADGLAKYFMKIATIAANGDVSSVSNRSSDSLVLIGYLDKEETAGDYFLATAFEVEFMNFSLPMNSSEAVTMEVPYRLVGGTDPVLYKVTNA